MFHSHKTPIEVLPGDELHTVCVYNSMDRNLTTFRGIGTRDEMCYSFLHYYPKEAIRTDSASRPLFELVVSAC